MTQQTDKLSRAHTWIKQMLDSAKLDLALQHAEDWGADQPPSNRLGEDGSSSTPTERAERLEIRRVVMRANAAPGRIKHLVNELESAARALYAEVCFFTEVTDVSKLPPAEPGCVACHRVGVWGQVYAKSVEKGLCRSCWEFSNATGQMPPEEWCRRRDLEGGGAANRWLAREHPKLLKTIQAAKGPKVSISAEDLALRAEDVIVDRDVA